MSDQQTEVYYVLVCLECGGGPHIHTPDCRWDCDEGNRLLPMPFESAEARGEWAAAHTKGTGHDRFIVRDQPRARP